MSDLAWWLSIAPTLKWRRARSMPDWPHSYVIREDTPGLDFERAARTIRSFGEPGMFYDKTRIYLSDGTMKWWTMDGALADCYCINQALVADGEYGDHPELAPHTHRPPELPTPRTVAPYQELAPYYDQRYDPDHCPECAAENAAVWREVTRWPLQRRATDFPSVLDLGCGTGLALDLRLVPRHRDDLYVGVDPSQAMLNELVRKHPWVRTLCPSTAEEYVASRFRAPRPEPIADTVLALFGSASYFQPETIRALPSLTGRLLVLMNYRPGYLPDYHHGDPAIAATSQRSWEAAVMLPHALTTRLNNFDITTWYRSQP